MATSVPPTSVPAKGTSGKIRSVCFTLNNWTNAELTLCKAFAAQCSYLIVAEEVGEHGTPHLQGYAEFANPRATGENWKNMKKCFGSERYHFEPRRGTAQQASDYCEYADYPECIVKNDPLYKFGEISQQGNRTDWNTAVSTLATKTVVDVIQTQPQLLPAIRALERYKQLVIEPIEREVRVIVLIGPPGTGKSHYCWEKHPNLFSKSSGQWWDGYNGEETILLDDFYGDYDYPELLKVLDRYKYRVPIKGAFVGARWTTVYITSNQEPERWYKQYKRIDALNRRISEKIYLTEKYNHA